MRTYLLILFSVFVTSGCGKSADQLYIDSLPQRSSELTSVTGAYGPLIVTEGDFEAQSATKPWSSWWFPADDPYLFQKQSGKAPLEKYDAYAKSNDRAAESAKFEKEKIYDPQANGWEGLCKAWAVASISEPEPSAPIEAGGVHFDVGDLKALLVKTYEEVDGQTYFGQRNNGDRNIDFDDIYPDQLHKLLQAELFGKQRPIIVDKDPGLPVWNTPIWKAEFQIEKDPTDIHLLHVNAWLHGVSPMVPNYDFVGTLDVVYWYTYDLYGIPNGNGSWTIYYGKWTGSSTTDHPDFASVVPEKPAHHSRNTEIDPALVSQILGR